MSHDIFAQFESETAFRTETAEQYHDLGFWGDMSCCDYLDLQADEQADRPAVVDDTRTLTWSELRDRVDQLAAGLQSIGVEKGNIVAFRLPHVVEWFVVRLAVSRAGALSVPLYPRFQEREITHVLESVEPDVYIGMGGEDTTGLEVAQSLADDVSGLDHVFALESPPADVAPYEELTDVDAELTPQRIDPDYPDALSLSSGTTGDPKIYYFVQNTFLTGGKDIRGRYCVTETDSILALTPVQQAFGHLVSLYLPLVTGATIWLTNRSDPGEQWELFQTFEPTHIVAIPTQTTKIMNAAQQRDGDLSFVRVFINGGAPLPKETAEVVEENGTVVVTDYGAGDGGLSNAGCPMDSQETRFETVGTPQPSMKTLVINEDGEQVPTGDVGEIIMTGAGCGFGYYEDRERTEEVYDIGGPHEGWFHTNDAGIVDEHGNLTVVGRIDEMILRGGQNVYPVEIEDHLLEIDAVNEAAVIGMPDPELGERICAYVVPAGDAEFTHDDVVEWFEAGNMATFKCPERLELVDELPRSPGGKIKKSSLREDIEATLRDEGRIEE